MVGGAADGWEVESGSVTVDSSSRRDSEWYMDREQDQMDVLEYCLGVFRRQAGAGDGSAIFASKMRRRA